ncbi:DUF6281 family protein [Streptomyces sp. NPDC060027]|uniref:DUF6281 family protein n=1 Tax=Streptomyces sp. NPDC060027 TaxID=3347040 RepID=UPI003694920F
MKAVLPSRRGPVGMLLAAAVLAVSVACTPSSDDGTSASSCVFLVDYQNHEYSDVANVDFTVGDKLGPATLPSCNDTPDDDDDAQPPSPTTAYAVKGVDPSIAIAVGDTPSDTRLVAVHSGNKIPPEVKELIRGS